MNNPKKVLVVGRHQSIMDKVIQALESHGYNSFGVSTDTKAVTEILSNDYDAVIFGGGVEMASRKIIMDKTNGTKPNIKFIDAHPHTVLDDLKSAFV